ncbi:MAG: hypothetical protein IMW89_09770 [Ktedonobacteraceae bacterium]|nr:hypothetical protein [Ktedonobacteraceae bacterium]
MAKFTRQSAPIEEPGKREEQVAGKRRGKSLILWLAIPLVLGLILAGSFVAVRYVSSGEER